MGVDANVLRFVLRSRRYHSTTSEACDAAETFAFHFTRAFSVKSQQIAPDNIGLILTSGKMGALLMVKR
jgi:hypothetical protein